MKLKSRNPTSAERTELCKLNSHPSLPLLTIKLVWLWFCVLWRWNLQQAIHILQSFTPIKVLPFRDWNSRGGTQTSDQTSHFKDDRFSSTGNMHTQWTCLAAARLSHFRGRGSVQICTKITFMKKKKETCISGIYLKNPFNSASAITLCWITDLKFPLESNKKKMDPLHV